MNPAETVHVLIDQNAGWHSKPLSDEAFQALIRKHPRYPIRLAWIHLPPDEKARAQKVESIKKNWPDYMEGDVELAILRAFDNEVEHARYYLQIGTTDPLGFPITDENRVKFWRAGPPEDWAIEVAQKMLDSEKAKRTLADAKAERWTDQRRGGKPKRKRTPRERCPESGKVTFFEPTPGMAEYDRCPNCGRVVRIMADGRVPEHTFPSTLRGPS